MKVLGVLSACALLALSAPALAQNSPNSAQDGLQKNGSPNGAAGSAAKQPGKSDAGAGQHDMSEGRSSATDSKMDGASGGMNSKQTGTGSPAK